MTENKKCAHPVCGCTAQDGSDFCGPYCAEVGKKADIECKCGHTPCSEVEPVIAGAELVPAV